ncbi:disease resistance protein RPV1-like [Prosopis cineraria]|uniref:disease resistance protein RPV1-like n=1 Tax=Prosopis cineraria TaxID=364024 RepID=UPI00240F39C1|nr:disease resistance protein RPV1-like [Prosopis cineraria]XP_054813434.1 disease resistance protein RPV1-like [Prosopis cineraria]
MSHISAAGIVTFRDDELRRGGVISEELLQAIEQSMFSIVVLSQNCASSSWCLEELEKIMASRQDLGQIVVPVFYGVDPSIIRHQENLVATAFEKHEVRFSYYKVRRWREALTKVAKCLVIWLVYKK